MAREGKADAYICDQLFYMDLHRACDERYKRWWQRPLRWGCYSTALMMASAVVVWPVGDGS